MTRLLTRTVPLAAALMMAAPALASAAQSLAVTSPTGFPAGGHPSYTTATTLDSSAGTPSKVTIAFAPGVLANPNANVACISGPPKYTSACQIGGGSATIPPLSVPFTAYLVKPPNSNDAAGIDLVTHVAPVTHAGAAIVQTPAGKVQTVLSLDLSGLAAHATSMRVTVDGTLNGKPFTRMPTNCSPGSTTLTVVYTKRTETTTASPDFKPTGCSSLPYAPKMTGSIVKDLHDQGVAATTTVTQAPDEAASAENRLRLPFPTVSPNLAVLSLQNTKTPVGAATSASPLLPHALQGKVFLTGQPAAPSLTIKFPPPVALTLTGVITPSQWVTFKGVPDVPVTSLTVKLFGGPKALLAADCNKPTGPLQGGFVGQNGKVVNTSHPITLANCPGTPRVSGAKLSGLSKGKPALSFRLSGARNGPKLKRFTLSLPAGLKFVAGGLAKGVAIKTGHSARLAHGALTVTFKKPAAGVSVRVAPAALHEASSLRRGGGKHLKLKLSVTDALGKTFALTAPV